MSDQIYYYILVGISIVWFCSSLFRMWISRQQRKQLADYEKEIQVRLEQLSEQVDQRASDFQEVVDVINHEYYQLMNDQTESVSTDLKAKIKSVLDDLQNEQQNPSSPTPPSK